MKTSLLLLIASGVVLGLTVLDNGTLSSAERGFSDTDKELIRLLAENKYTGKIEKQLEVKLGRKLDPKKVELGRLIFFDKGLAWHQDNSCAGCHSPMVGFGDSQFMAIGIENNGVVGDSRTGPHNQRRSPMALNTGFYPSLMWNSRISANSDDPFDNSKGFTFPAPEGETFFPANDARFKHLLVAQAHIPFTELPEMAGFRNAPEKFNMSRFQGFLLSDGSVNSGKKRLSDKTLFTNTQQTPSDKKTDNAVCKEYDVFMFSDDDTGFPLPPFENTFVNFPIRRKIIELINAMPEYRRLFTEIYPQVKTSGIEFFMIGQAIAEFELFLTFANAPIDKFAVGQYDALTEEQKKGAILFFKKGNCVSCHSVSGKSNEMFSDFAMHNIGVPQITPTFGIKTGNVGFATLDKTMCANGAYDLGRFEFDGLDGSKFKFRTSPLRNLILQPFYFHNGSFDDLRKAVVFHLNPKENIDDYEPRKNGIPAHITYQRDGMKYVMASLDKALENGIKLTKTEVDNLVDFLSVGLLDQDAKSEKLAKLIPTKLPSGAPVATFEAGHKKSDMASSTARLSAELTNNESTLWVRVYPNPFVDRATVEYNLPVGGAVRHTLLDAKGAVLRQVQEGGEQPAGRHQLQLSGVSLPPGPYLYRIQVGVESRTVRLIRKE